MGGSLGTPPALPPSGLTLQLMGPGRHPSGPAATLHAVELRCLEPREHSLDTQVALALITGSIPWTGCYDAKQ